MTYLCVTWSYIMPSLRGSMYLKKQDFRKEIWSMSWWTMLLGLAEPLYVPKYKSTKILFNHVHVLGFWYLIKL